MGLTPGSTRSAGAALLAAGLASIVIGVSAGPATAAGTYTAVDLGGLGGPFGLVAHAVNEHGWVAGESTVPATAPIDQPAGSPGGWTSHAVLWRDGQRIDLGTLGGRWSRAYAINDAGVVVGESERADGSVHAFRCQPGGIPEDLGTLGGRNSAAYGINGKGKIVGSSDTAVATSHAARWTGGDIADLGTLGGPTSVARAINDAGAVVGESRLASGQVRGFVLRNGSMVDLGSLAGPTGASSAYAINRRGVIAGWSTAPGAGASWQHHPATWSAGRWRDLGVQAGGHGEATGISDHGLVVGTELARPGIGIYVAVVWTRNGMVELPEVGTRGEQAHAYAINNAGRVVGQQRDCDSATCGEHALQWQPARG